ncbi:MAG: DUF885 domain-containing protein [Phycisphaerales bacterium]
MKSALLRTFGLALVQGCVVLVVPGAAGRSEPAAATAPPAPAATAPADQVVLDLLAEDLEDQDRADPFAASRRGVRRFDTLLPDVSLEGIRAQLDRARDRLARAKLIDAASLSAMRRTERAMLIDALETRLAAERFRSWEMMVTQISGPQYELAQMPQSLSFTTDKQLEDFAARIEAIPGYLDEATGRLQEGLARGFTPPRSVLGRVADQAFAHGGSPLEGDATRHALYAPFAGKSGPIAERAKKAILESIAPAFDRFGMFLRERYVAEARRTLGASELPDGKAFYEYRVRAETTLDFDADAIHRIGMDEVIRIRGEMMDTIRRSDFKPKTQATDDDDLFAQFIAYLRTDPRFYARTPDELLTRYRAAGKIIDAELPRLFVALPVLPWGVREMPRFIAPSSPTAYYYAGSIENGVAGYFVANTHALDQRPLYDTLPLTLHEAVPGHHFQVALAQELKGVPEWRTTTGYTGFVEGWALYAEKLGLEMGEDARSPSNPSGRGLFTDPYDDFGRLNFEMWRALRLVVDTGIHAKGWTRDQAITFMERNSALARNNIEREVDRYIVWPGQAVAYKLGELHILQLRAEAEETLGTRFDIRGFHRAVLGRGAVPLKVLSEQVREWVEQRGAEPRP